MVRFLKKLSAFPSKFELNKTKNSLTCASSLAAPFSSSSDFSFNGVWHGDDVLLLFDYVLLVIFENMLSKKR